MSSRHRPWFILTTGLLVLTVVFVSLVRAVLLPEFRFPRPTGPYAIGTVTYHWTDPDRREILGPTPGGPREVMAQIWYPAEAVAGPRTPYIPDADTVIPALARIFHLPAVALHSLRGIVTNAAENAPAAQGSDRFPVILLFTGLGGFRQVQTYLAEELVSHGYVVVGVDQPYTAAAVAFPDGRVAEMPSPDEIGPLVRQGYLPLPEAPELGGEKLEDGIIPFLGQDVGFVIDRLDRLNAAPDSGPVAGRLDMTRIGAAGISLGGLVVGDAIRTEPRITAALMLDAPVPLRTTRTPVGVPSMWITRPPDTMRLERERSGGWSEEQIAAHHRTMRATFDQLQTQGYFVQIPDISHVDFTDAPLWSPALRWFGMTGPKPGAYAHRVIDDYALSFFRRHLSGLPAPLLDRTEPTYPGVTLEVHSPH